MSKDANFRDLKALVNTKTRLDVISGSKDTLNNEDFYYISPEEVKEETKERLSKTDASPEEIKEVIGSIETDPAKQSKGLGVTLSPDDKQSPNGNWTVIVSDGTGSASDAPKSEFAAAAAHELYGHALPGIQGKPWTHEYTDPPGPVDVNTYRIIEPRTRQLYKKP